MRKSYLALVLGLAVALMGTAAFAKSGMVVKIGGTSISHVFYEAIESKFRAKGYDCEFIMFDSNPVVLEACASGAVDIAIGQHKKYVRIFSKNNNTNLDMVKPYGMYTGIGLYSKRYKTSAEFPEGARIAVMNDAMNENIALRILEKERLIEVAKDVQLATTADILSNPKKLKIIEMDQAQTVTTLDDMAGACIFFTHMSAAKGDPSSYIARDDVMGNIPMGAITKAENLSAGWAIAFAECFRDPTVQKQISSVFPGVFEFYVSDEQVKE